jgi:predicted helicase
MDNIKGLPEFEQYVSGLATAKEKGDMMEWLALHLLRHIPLYKEVYLYNSIPDHVLRQLNLPAGDKGLDLLVKTSNEWMGVQVKFRANETTIVPYGDMATFMAQNFAVARLQHGIVITNCVDVCQEVRNPRQYTVYKRDQILECSTPEFWDSFRAWLVAKTAPPILDVLTPKTPRPAQLRMLNALDAPGERGYIMMACGTGKTLVCYWYQKIVEAKRCIFAVPSLYLLSGAFEAWKREQDLNGEASRHLLVGSDADSRLSDVRLTTNEAEIRRFLEDESDVPCFVWTTYHSSFKIVKVCREIGYTFDLMFCDEAHRTVGGHREASRHPCTHKNLGVIVESDIAKRTRFVTATPRRVIGGMDCRSMDNERLYGPCLGSYNIMEAIRDKVLVDYELLVPVVTSEQVRSLVSSRGCVMRSNHAIDAQCMLAAFVICDAFRRGSCRKMLCFSNRNERSREIQKCIQALDPTIHVLVLDGTTSMQRRRRAVGVFLEKEKSCICSARIFLEGADIPQVDSICFAQNKESTTDIVQGVGRCIRTDPTKSKPAQVLIPCLLETGKDIFDPESGPHFRHMRKCLEALGCSDKDVWDKVLIMPQRLGDYATHVPGKIKDVDEVDQKVFLEALQTHTFDRDGSSAEKRDFALLKLNAQSKRYHSDTEYLSENPNPQHRFAKYWNGWYDFLGIATHTYPDELNDWLRLCQEHGITSVQAYFDKQKEIPTILPVMPAELYEDFTNISDQLGILYEDDDDLWS